MNGSPTPSVVGTGFGGDVGTAFSSLWSCGWSVASWWRVAAEMRLFAALVDGDRVRWQRTGGVAEGCIVEKCRYGAILVTRDGRLIAVGFRRLWPAIVRPVA